MKQPQTSILITGASTGIGRDAAIHWAKRGHHVIAGVRREDDGKALRAAAPEIEPVILDVTKDDHVQKAWETVAKKNITGPFHLVNNAGIAVTGPLEALPLEDLRRQFEVNFFGVVRMIQTFLPLLRKTQGRIVNVSSVSGQIATPYMSPYSASKFALEGLSDSLRRELAPFGVKVILIEPGPIDTPIWNKGFQHREKLEAKFDKNIVELYRPYLEKFIAYAEKAAKHSDPVEKVTAKLDRALFLNNPSARYPVGLQAQAGAMIAKLPSKLVDSLIRRT